MPVPVSPPGASIALVGAVREGLQPVLVDRLRDEPADVRVHPAGLVDEQAALGRDRRVLAEQVLQHRHAGPRRMDRLGDLGELLGIAEQDHDCARTCPSRARRQARSGRPRRSADNPAFRPSPPGRTATRSRPRGRSRRRRSRRSPWSSQSALARTRSELPSSAPHFFRPVNGSPGGAYSSTSASRLWIAAWLPEATPTRWPCSIRCRIR